MIKKILDIIENNENNDLKQITDKIYCCLIENKEDFILDIIAELIKMDTKINSLINNYINHNISILQNNN